MNALLPAPRQGKALGARLADGRAVVEANPG
jgi:hypothetical protein